MSTTTKPFVSQAQAGWAFATGQPFARRWARATGPYKRLPYHKRTKKSFDVADLEAAVAAALPPPVVDAIAAQCDALPTLKAESLGPGVSRIRGDLCNVHGRYGSCSAAGFGSAPAPKKPGPVKTPTFMKPRKPLAPPKPKKGGGGKGAKPKKAGGGKGAAAKKPTPTPEEKRQQKLQEQAQHRADALRTMNIAPDGQAALEAMRRGEQPDPAAVARGGFEQAGLVERARDGSYRLTPSGRAALSAADSGDRGRLGSTISAARDRTTARGERQAAAADRKRQAAARRQAVAARRAGRAPSRGRISGRLSAAPPISGVLSGKAMNMTTKAGSPGDYLVVEDPAKPSTWHLQVRRNGKPDHRLMGAAWAALHGGYRGNTYQGPNKAQALAKLRALYAAERLPVPSEKAAGSFSVFKDAAGCWRWVAISSTAFRDRDGEIVSAKALADDVARADATGQYVPLRAYGPLLWWHVPTLNLGTCDFNALDGRVLIESGTFATEAIAQKVAAVAADLEVSIGFTHPPSEPDGDGVFHTIRRFERSLTPRGKASNLFTSFAVKEVPMLDDVKRAALKALGFDDDMIAGIERQSATAQKAADEAGVAYKADDPPAPETTDPPALEEITIGGVTYTLAVKAPPPDMGMMADAEAPAEDMSEGGMEEPDDAAGGLTLSPEDLSAIGQAVGAALQAALGPLVGAMDLTNKMGAHMADLKTMMAGYTAKKDSEAAEQRAQVDALAATVNAQGAQLAELAGLAPAAVTDRPSQSASTRVAADDPLVVSATKEADPAFPFSDLMVNLFGRSAG